MALNFRYSVGEEVHIVPRGKAKFKLAIYAARSISASLLLVACFHPSPPLEDGDERDSGLTTETSPTGDTTTQGHPLLKKRHAAKAELLPTPGARSTPAVIYHALLNRFFYDPLKYFQY